MAKIGIIRMTTLIRVLLLGRTGRAATLGMLMIIIIVASPAASVIFCDSLLSRLAHLGSDTRVFCSCCCCYGSIPSLTWIHRFKLSRFLSDVTDLILNLKYSSQRHMS